MKAFVSTIDIRPQTSDSGSLAGANSVVRTPSNRLALKSMAIINTITHMPMVVQGRPALRRANASGDKLKPESTEGGGRVSALKRQEGAPVLLG